LKKLGASVSSSGKDVIPEELAWAECSSSLAIASGLFHLCSEVRSIVRTDGRSTTVIELEDGLTRRLEVGSNLLCATGTGSLPQQHACSFDVTMEDFVSLTLKCRGTP
jgi:activator of 2-hydroxyglutaryl-CoA dehydratase